MTMAGPRPADCQSAIQPTISRRYFKYIVQRHPLHLAVAD